MKYDRRMENPLTIKLRGMIRVLRERNDNLSGELAEAQSLQADTSKLDIGQSDQTQLNTALSRIKRLETLLTESRETSQNYRSRLLKTQERYREMREMVLHERERVRKLRNERNEARILSDKREASQAYFEDLMAGVTEYNALLNFVRRASAGSGRILARSFCHWLYQQENRKEFGAIAIGTFLISDELFEASLSYFNDAGYGQAWNLAPIELMTAFLGVHGNKKLPDCMNWVEKQNPECNAEELYLAIKTFIRFGYFNNARDICNRLLKFKKNNNIQLNSDQLLDLEWMSLRLIENLSSNNLHTENETVNIAVMDYKLVDRKRTSSNRGDYVQTLAALSNILRFNNVEYSGNCELDKHLNELKLDVHNERQINLPNGPIKARAFALDRDFASGRKYPKNTWLLCNGWFMHRNFKGKIDFPFPDSINPIFISFHINDPSVLTTEVAEQLKKSEPIGCRDWTTVYRLRQAGVSSFFSGCLTTTIGQILPAADKTNASGIALVESRISKTETTGLQVDEYSQVGDYVRNFSLVDGLKDANSMLRNYLPYSKIKTSRLHCYLPCRSMGFDVEFSPRNKSDIRFEGLLDLTTENFTKIRTKIEEKLEIVFKAIFERKTYDEVINIWKDICSTDISEADAYLKSYTNPDVSEKETSNLVKEIKITKAGTENPKAVHLAFATDENLMGYFPTVLQSVLDNTTSPIIVHFMYRGLPKDYLHALPSAFPTVAFRLYDMNDVNYGEQVRMLKHTTISTMDRCLLPEVIHDQNKVVYLDIDILVRSDISELYNIDINNYFVAGKLSNLKSWASVIKLVTRGSLFLEPDDAWNFRRRIHDQHSLYETTFNAGVIVMNLKSMRTKQFSSHALNLISHCHLNDQDVLNIFGASNTYELDPDWNYVPAQDYSENPKIIHWAGVIKSWSSSPILWKDEFLKIAERAPDIAGYTWRGNAKE